MKIEKLFRPIPTLSKRMFHTNRGRNLVAVLAILLTTMMFTTLFTLSQSGQLVPATSSPSTSRAVVGRSVVLYSLPPWWLC